MEVIRAAVLIAATLTMGVMAGVFQLYTYAIMPGLRRTNPATFVSAFQSIDRAIINPWFMASFFGALVFSGVAALMHLGSDYSAVLPWVLVAFVAYLVVVVITLVVNVPLNDAIKAAGDAESVADVEGVRQQFNEGRWARWNLVRTLLTTAALACLAWALVEYGKA